MADWIFGTPFSTRPRRATGILGVHAILNKIKKGTFIYKRSAGKEHLILASHKFFARKRFNFFNEKINSELFIKKWQ